MARVRLDDDDDITETIERDEAGEAGDYFADQLSPVDFIPSGGTLLDCTLGGGWPLTRISNVVGDESTGKTLLAIEASANFHRKWPKGEIFYREAEIAFDQDYAETLGMPVDAVDFIESENFTTIEDFYEDLKECTALCKKKGVPGLYVVDSLDALSDKAEQKLGFDEGSYSMTKPKQMSKLFRQLTSEVAKANMHLMIISQTRDKIGSQFVKKTRSGGRALDFYASQVLWLSHRGDVDRQVGGVKRVTAIEILAKCDKNKIALPRRRCEFTITFGHGIDSMASNMEWLEKEVKRWDEVFDVKRTTYRQRLERMNDADYWAECTRVDKEVRRIWREVEKDFQALTRPKYRD